MHTRVLALFALMTICCAAMGQTYSDLIGEQKWTTSDGMASDFFGRSIATAGDAIVVGCPSDDNENGTDAGSVYFYSLLNGSWVESKKVASTGEAGDWLGASVDIDGSAGDFHSAIAGNPNSSTLSSSGAYIFEHVIGTDFWIDSGWLMGSDTHYSDAFGVSVGISGVRAVVGAPYDDDNGSASGSVYLFERAALWEWNQVEKITAWNGDPGDYFGLSVAVDGSRVVVGAPRDSSWGPANHGCIYVFELDGGWDSLLVASDREEADWFGYSVDIDGDRIVASAIYDDDNGSNAGSVYVWELSKIPGDPSCCWFETAKLTASDGGFSGFGNSVSIEGDRIVVGGAADDDNGGLSGSVYVYELINDTWVETKLTPSDGAENDNFGFDVGISDDRVVVGAPYDDDNGSGSGSAYIHPLNAVLNMETSVGYMQLSEAINDASSGDRLALRSPAFDGQNIISNAGKPLEFITVGPTTIPDTAVWELGSNSIISESLGVNDSRWRLNGLLEGPTGGSLDIQTSQAFVVGEPWSVIDTSEGNPIQSTVETNLLSELLGPSVAGVWTLEIADQFQDSLTGEVESYSVRIVIDGQTHQMTDSPSGTGGFDLFTAELDASAGFVHEIEVSTEVYHQDPYWDLTVALVSPSGDRVWLQSWFFGDGPYTYGPATGKPLPETPSARVTLYGTSLLVPGGLHVESDQLRCEGDMNEIDGSVLIGPTGRIIARGDTNVTIDLENNGESYVHSGILDVQGDLTNKDVLECASSNTPAPPESGDGISVGGNCTVDRWATLSMDDPLWWLRVGGDLDVAIDDPTRFAMSEATIQMMGENPAIQNLEAMSADFGADEAGFDPSNFPIGTLRIGANSVTSLVNNHPNADECGDVSEYQHSSVGTTNGGVPTSFSVELEGPVSAIKVSGSFLNETGDSTYAGDVLIGVMDSLGNAVELGGYDDTFGYTVIGDFSGAWNVPNSGDFMEETFDASAGGLSGNGTWTIQIHNGWLVSAGATWDLDITFCGPHACEVLYVDELVVSAGGTLITNTCPIYARSATIDGTVDDPDAIIIVEGKPDCPGDIDGNGEVSGADLAIVLGAWGSNDAAADVNGDNTVDGVDLAIVLGAWGACSGGL